MIRPFTIFCKLNEIRLSDCQWFAVEAASLTPCTLECPSCGAKGCMKPFASYERYLVEMGEGEGEGASVHTVRIQRLRCSSCGHTHAFHPSCLVPYRSHSLRLILWVLQCYFLHLKTVAQLCDTAGISVSTLYRWVGLFLAQKKLWLGVPGDLEKEQGSFLEGLSGQVLLDFLAAMRFCKWYALYSRGGMDALMPKERSDKGHTRVITPEAEEEIRRVRREYPRLNATQIREKLVQDALLPATVSVSSVQRYIKRNGLRGETATEGRDRKAFEEAYFGGMWQADTCYLPYIREDGRSRRTYLIMILDDYSRMIVGGCLFYQENAANFQKVLKTAVATYGIPQKLYVDNGAPYSNEQLGFICGSVGIVLIHTPVRDGASKGKVERNFRTLKERWLYGIDVSQIRSLEEFNRMLADYIRRHNTTIHSGTGQTPLSRYLASNERVRRPKSREWLEECFHNRLTRRVNRDATVHLERVCYDAPMQFIGQKVEVRFLPGDTESAYILYGGERYPLRVTDRVANSRTKRQKEAMIDYGKEMQGNVH